MKGRRTLFAVLGLGLVGSQAGHLLAYQIRFGAAAQQVQSTGAHSYFPGLAKMSLGVAAAAALAGLLLIAFARILAGHRVRASSQPSYVGLLAALFTLQLAVFAVQEIVESMIAGSMIGTAPQLLLWGTLGQLPVAAVAALALRWLSTRVEAAVGAIRDVVAATVWMPLAAPVAIPVCAAPDRALLMSRVAGSSLATRGPPSSSRISSN
ncbi:MAG TPA: hypothetical protein VGA41_07740 [Candidatus Dormibacteraeota bacterium]